LIYNTLEKEGEGTTKKGWINHKLRFLADLESIFLGF